MSNLRQNMLVLPNSPECAALRANVEGNRLNSRFQHTHKNKSVKAHEVVEENWLSFRMNIVIQTNISQWQ